MKDVPVLDISNCNVCNGFKINDMKTDNELKITIDDFKLIKSFYTDFTRRPDIQSNEFIIGWSELMPVVHKLYDVIDDESKSFNGLVIFELGIAAPIEMVYSEAVNAIKWYNQQPK